MKLGDLHHAAGAVKTRKRVGKGRGTGQGGTSGRGNKGEGQRSGTKYRARFEGGQMPLQRRVPKRGFKRPEKVVFQVVDVGQVSALGAAEVTRDLLVEKGLARKNGGPIKLLADGDAGARVTVRVDAASRAARAKIEAAGGTVTLPAQPGGAA
jgi:large subunit ribosomal protein L15